MSNTSVLQPAKPVKPPAETKTPKSPEAEGVGRVFEDPIAVERYWTHAAMGTTVQARLLDGKTVTGKLTGVDRYTVQVNPNGDGRPVLLFKHALALLRYPPPSASDEKAATNGNG
jgi:sRNA-binding regulator protein Hfq